MMGILGLLFRTTRYEKVNRDIKLNKIDIVFIMIFRELKRPFDSNLLLV